MIQMGTRLKVADNSGAKMVRCIKVLGGAGHMHASSGAVIKVSVISAIPNASVKKGEVHSAVIINTKKGHRLHDGSTIRADINSVVLLDSSNRMIGTRVFGPVPKRLRNLGFSQIVSLAGEVI